MVPEARLAVGQIAHRTAEGSVSGWRFPPASGVALFGLLAATTAFNAATVYHRREAWLALTVVPLALALRTRPVPVALLVMLGGLVLRLAYVGASETDQVAVAQAAARTAFAGGNPYGHGYAETIPPGAPYPYGPLGLVVWLPGIWVELAASIATMILVARSRAWLTLGLTAGSAMFASYPVFGVNDSTPGLLITAGLLVLRRRPFLGGVLLALAAGLKPYAFAWAPAAVAYGGLSTLVGGAMATALLWSPLLIWGPASFLRSVELAENLPHHEVNALNAPVVRLLAVPLAGLSLLARRWEWVVLSGAAVFAIVLFAGKWASAGYWLAVVPILGILGEAEILPGWYAARRARAPGRREDGRASDKTERCVGT